MKNKIVSLFLFIVALWGVLLIRAAYLQFLPHERLNALQTRQFQTVVTLASRRGDIIDRNGKDLAMSAPAYSVYADPQIIENRKMVAQILGKALNMPPSKISGKMKDKSKRFVWIERLVPSDVTDKLKDLKLRGIGFVEESKRVYPNDFMLSSTLGFVGQEGNGLEGIELAFDRQLRGEDKKITLRKDAKGRPLLQDGMMFRELPQGKQVKLTIDSDLQFFVETELMQALKKHDAEGAYAVVLDARTSAIRSVVSLPHYDLNNPQKFNNLARRNRSITDTFEPGSTLKTFILAEGLEQKIYEPNSKIFCENGSFRIGKRVIREAEKDHAQGTISLSEVLAYSSNIGTSKVALRLGAARVESALRRFGFGRRSQVDLPGEAKGIMVNLPWSNHLLANVSFGQGITTTPLQIANAYAAIANGGVLNTPYVVESITDLDGEKQDDLPTRTATRVVSEGVARQMRKMLVGVTTDKGTGLSARVPGFVVGGKTGTAQKVSPTGGGYIQGGYIASFAGFIPANDPQYVIFVAIDYPKKAGYYGAQIAGPVFSSIASYVVRKDGLAPDVLGEKNISHIPEVQLAQKNDLKDYSFDELSESSSRLTAAPDIKNLSLREALEKINNKDIKLKVIGSGRIYQTDPEAGEALNANRIMTIHLRE